MDEPLAVVRTRVQIFRTYVKVRERGPPCNPSSGRRGRVGDSAGGTGDSWDKLTNKTDQSSRDRTLIKWTAVEEDMERQLQASTGTHRPIYALNTRKHSVRRIPTHLHMLEHTRKFAPKRVNALTHTHTHI